MIGEKPMTHFAPRAAVIMPAYNAEGTIEKTVRSILGQSMGDLVLIVVDDGSTDETAAILSRLQAEDGRLLPIRLPNGGPARARNAGLDAVPPGTEYLMFSDADDLLEPDALLYAIENAGDADLVLMGFSILEPDGSEQRYFEPAARYTPDTLGASLGRLYKANLLNQVWGKLFRARLVLDNCVDGNRTKPFRMLKVFKKVPNVPFLKLGNVVFFASFGVIALSLVIFAVRLMNNRASVLAVDLTGGTSIVYSLDQEKKPAVGDVRKALDAFDNAAIIQYQQGVGDATLLVKTGETAETEKGKAIENHDVGGHVTKLLQAKFPDANLKQVSVDEVGSMVGADLKKSGTWAVILSLCAILIYVGFRFEFGFGLGALVALAHDALISLGLFSLCGRQVSLIVVTALLTIIGYSVNDTIVVFDRIREDLRKDQKTPFKELCDRSVNATLSRTVITSVTTLFAVLALFCFGDGSIFDFALTMLIGIIAGTFSSMFIATPIMVWWYRGKRPQFEKTEKKPQA